MVVSDAESQPIVDTAVAETCVAATEEARCVGLFMLFVSPPRSLSMTAVESNRVHMGAR